MKESGLTDRQFSDIANVLYGDRRWRTLVVKTMQRGRFFIWIQASWHRTFRVFQYYQQITIGRYTAEVDVSIPFRRHGFPAEWHPFQPFGVKVFEWPSRRA